MVTMPLSLYGSLYTTESSVIRSVYGEVTYIVPASELKYRNRVFPEYTDSVYLYRDSVSVLYTV